MNPKTISQVLEEFEKKFPYAGWNCLYDTEDKEENKKYKSFIKSSLEEILMSMPLEEVKICGDKYNSMQEDINYGMNLKVKEVKEWREQTLK